MAEELFDSIVKAICIARKDARIYYFKPPAIMFGLIFPVFLYFAFYVGRSVEPSTLLPSLVAIASFFGSSSIQAVSLPIERRAGTLDRLLAAPVSLYAIVLGKALAGFAFGFALSMIFALMIILFSGVSLANPPLFVIGATISSLTASALGMPVSTYAKEVPEAMMPLNLIRLPMIFLCGVFTPVETIPASLRVLSYLLPLTYSVDALRQATTGSIVAQTFLIDLVVLTLYLFVLLVIATKTLEKRIE